MRILFITDHYSRKGQIGGGEVIAQTLTEGLFSEGYEVLLFCCKGKQYKAVKESYIKRVFTSIGDLRKLNPTKLFFELLKEQINVSIMIKKFKPDLIFFLQNGRISTPTFSFLNNLPIPKVFRIGGMWYRLYDAQSERCPWVSYWKNTNNPIIKYVIRFLKYLKKDIVYFYKFNQINPDRIIVNSNDLSLRVSDILNSNVTIDVIKNGIDTNIFKFKPHTITKSIRLLYVGGFRKNKGVDILINMMSYLSEHYSDLDFKLTLVGWSSNKCRMGQLNELIRINMLEDNITFKGSVLNEILPEIYENHDIFVFPTSNMRIEGCPSVILEAMACGIPIVANLGPGTNEVLKNNETCVEAIDDPKELGDAIVKLISDQYLYEKIQNNALGIINKNHTAVNMIRSIDNVIKEIVA